MPFVVNVVVLKIKKKEDKNNKEDKDKIKEINMLCSKGTNNKYHNINNHKIINYQKQCNKV